MRDFLPSDVRKREYVIGIIKEVYESYGFEPLETPAVENIETLMGKYGDEGNHLIFKILKRGDKLAESLESGVGSLEQENSSSDSRLKTQDSRLADLALRYDLTVPLARVVANNKNDLPKFFKRYQIQPVWRADRPARGRFREFYQCDVDVIGSKSLTIEAELISAVIKILTRLGFDTYRISLNNRGVLVGMLNSAHVPAEKHTDALVVLDKLDKIGMDGVFNELLKLGIPHEAADKLSYVQGWDAAAMELFDATANEHWNQFTLSYLKNTVPSEFMGSEEEKSQHLNSVHQLDSVLSLLSNSDKEKARLNFHLARGLSYYTGTIMEINVPDLAGSLGGGGRYDGLIGMFGKEQIPACGFSLGLERILVVMEEKNMFPPEIADSTPADVMVTIWNEETVPESLKLANELRSQGLRVTLYPEADKLGKQMKYADSIKVPWVCVLGESEIAEGKVTLKNMKTGAQVKIDRGIVGQEIHA